MFITPVGGAPLQKGGVIYTLPILQFWNFGCVTCISLELGYVIIKLICLMGAQRCYGAAFAYGSSNQYAPQGIRTRKTVCDRLSVQNAFKK